MIKSDGELCTEYTNALSYLNKVDGINSQFELRCEIILNNANNFNSWNVYIYIYIHAMEVGLTNFGINHDHQNVLLKWIQTVL